MTMAGREGRMLDSIYRTYGRPALWTPVDGSEPSNLVVRHLAQDVPQDFGPGAALARSNLIFVRRGLLEPADRDQVEITREGGGVETFQISADPRLEPNGLEWLCEATALDA